MIEGGRPLEDAEKLAWLRLIRSENVGPRTFKGLLDHYGRGRAVAALVAADADHQAETERAPRSTPRSHRCG